MSRRTTASKPSIVRTLDENVSFLPDSIEDFTKKTPLHPPGPEYDGPSQSRQDPFICLLALWKYLGDFITILEYSFTCTGQNPTHWRLKSHMVELGSYYEIPELNHLGRKKRIAVVFQRYFVELSNSTLPYLPFCQKLDLLVRDDSAGISAALTPSTATAATATTTNTTTTTTTTSSSTAAPHTPPTPAQVLLATPIPTKVNAFPKDVKWIIIAKAVFSETTGKPCGEISGLCVLEFELETLPAVESPTSSPASSLPTLPTLSSSSSSSSSSFTSPSPSSSPSPPSPPPSIKGLTWRTTEFSYLLNVFSAEQEYSTSPLESAGGHHANSPRLQHELTLKLGIDDTSPQSYFALREPRNDYKDDPTAFSMNSVEQSTECSLQGLQVIKNNLLKRHKLSFPNVKYHQRAQKPPRIKSAPPPSRSVPRPILAAPTAPASIRPGIFVFAPNKTNGSSTSPSGSRSPNSLSASVSASASPPTPSPGCCPSSSSGVSPTASSTIMSGIRCPRPNCEKVVKTTKSLNAHIKHTHDKSTLHSCKFDDCGASYTRKGDLKRHFKSQHKKDELRTCGKCGEALSREYNTTKHEKTCTGADGGSGRNKRKRKLSE